MARLDHIQCSEDARRAARRRLPRMLFDFIDGGAGEEQAVRRNREALGRIALLPRALVNVEARRTACDFLGRRWDLPFGIAPMGMCDLAWPGADRAFGDVARDHSIPHCLSTAASTSIEDCRARAGDNAWFQLYVSAPDTGRELVRRAGDAGYEHRRHPGPLPPEAGAAPGLQGPVPARSVPTPGLRIAPALVAGDAGARCAGFANNAPGGGETSRAFDRSRSRGGVDWAFLDALRDHWPRRLIVKGVLSPADARRIRDAGADAVYVSNHGGRQLDSAPAAIDALPGIRRAVGPGLPPCCSTAACADGEGRRQGIRARRELRSCWAGRSSTPPAAAGRAGVYRLIELLAEEVHTALAQIGCTDVGALDERVLARRDAASFARRRAA